MKSKKGLPNGNPFRIDNLSQLLKVMAANSKGVDH